MLSLFAPAAHIHCTSSAHENFHIDEAGGDSKLVAVPTEKICAMYKDIQKMEDLPTLLVSQIKHFFEHYKDLEPGKWVKLKGWGDADEARRLISEAIARAAKK